MEFKISNQQDETYQNFETDIRFSYLKTREDLMKYKATQEQLVDSGDREQKLIGLANLGFVHLFHDAYSQAKVFLKQAYCGFKDANNPVGIAHIHHRLAIVASAQEKYFKAYTLINQAIDYFHSINDVHHEGWCILTKSHILYDTDNYWAAKKLTKRALNMARSLGDTAFEARWLNGLAVEYEIEEREEDAEQAYSKSIQLFKQNGHQYGLVLPLINLGGLYTVQKKFEDSRQLLDQGLEITRKQEFLSQTSRCLRGLAVLDQKFSSSYEESLSLLEQNLEIWQEFECFDTIQRGIESIGNTYILMERPSEAVHEWYLSQLRKYELQHNKAMIHACRDLLSMHARQQRDFVKAVQHREECLRISRHLEIVYWIAEDLLGLGNIYYDQQKWPLALDFFNEAMQVVGNQELMVDLRQRWYYHLGFATRASGERIPAIEQFSEALILSNYLHKVTRTINWHKSLGYTYLQLSDFRKAHSHFTKAKILNESRTKPDDELSSLFETMLRRADVSLRD